MYTTKYMDVYKSKNYKFPISMINMSKKNYNNKFFYLFLNTSAFKIFKINRKKFNSILLRGLQSILPEILTEILF